MKLAGISAVVTGLAGCVSNEGDGGGGGNGDSAGHFLAGAPQSGPAALPGNHVLNGMELRYQEMQEEMDTVPEGIFENDEFSAETAVGCTTDALARHNDLFAWLGGYCSPTTLATMDTTEQEELLQIVTSFAPEVTESGHPYTFRASPGSRIVVPSSVDYAINELDAQRHAIIGLNNDWGISESEEWVLKWFISNTSRGTSPISAVRQPKSPARLLTSSSHWDTTVTPQICSRRSTSKT